jgi:hypothetical protein
MEENINTDFKETDSKVELAQDHVQWQALMSVETSDFSTRVFLLCV